MSLFKKADTKDKMLRNVQEASFALNEATLYLDTHPYDNKAQMYFDRYNELRKKAVMEYEETVGPLTVDNIEASKTGWTWIDTPFPWDEGVE